MANDDPHNLFAPRDDPQTVEQGDRLAPKFDEAGLIPVIAADAATGDVLMMAYMNAEALAETIRTGRAVYYSRSRAQLWRKGEESGHVQRVKQILVDCDQDTILLNVEQIGGAACHAGYRSCFYRAIDTNHADAQPCRLVTTESGKVFDPDDVYGKKP